MSLVSAIGNTPLVPLLNLNDRPRVKVLAKLEGSNPGGSVKDRPAHFMIKHAEESGQLIPGKTIVEPTSGNTGIALAMICACKGYSIRLFMPDCVSVERQLILRSLGAELTLTPAREGTDGAILAAHDLIDKEPDRYFMPDQFANISNIQSHYETTGPEIYSQTGGEINYLVAGMGTTGTLMGTGKYLKEKNPSIKIIGVEPSRGHSIQGLKNMSEAIVPRIYSPQILDEKITVTDTEAFETARLLATREGIFSGMSSGAATWVALRLANDITSGMIVVILPDRGDRYLSTTLFRSICARCPP